MSTTSTTQGWRVLAIGKHPEIAAAMQVELRDIGIAATAFAIDDSDAGDARLTRELTAAEYDGVLIGGFVSGQDPNNPPTAQTTRWFNRVLNLINARTPVPRVILPRNPADALAAIDRELGKQPS